MEGVPPHIGEGSSMTADERETMQLLVGIVNRDVPGRVTMTYQQCRALLQLYEANPLDTLWDYPDEVRQAIYRYSDRSRNRVMNALLITYLLRGAEDMVQLNVGRRMALGLLAMLEPIVRDRALRLAERWRKQREKERRGK